MDNSAAAQLACEKAPAWIVASSLLGSLRQKSLRSNSILANQMITATSSHWPSRPIWLLSLQVLTSMYESSIPYNRASFAAAFSQNWMISLSFLRKMAQVQLEVDLITRSALMKSVSPWQQAMMVKEDTTASGVHPNAQFLSTATAAVGDFGESRWAKVLQMFHLARRVDSGNYNSLLLASSWCISSILLRKMATAGLRPTTLSYSNYLQSLWNSHFVDMSRDRHVWELAWMVLAMMTHVQLERDVDAFQAGAHLSTLSEWPSRLLFLQQMRSSKAALGPAPTRDAEFWRYALSILSLPFSGHAIASADLVTLYDASIAACRTGQNSDLAQKWIERMRMDSLEPSSTTFSTLLGCFKQWEGALEVFHGMNNLNIPQDVHTYTSTLRLCNWQVGLLIWQQGVLHGMPNPTKMCSALVFALDSQWQWALYLLNQLGQNLGVSPDVVLYSACISACGSEWQQALGLFEAAVPERDVVDVVLYNAIISAFEKCGRWELAMHFLEEMELQRLAPDGITYSALISACEKGLQWQKALDVLNLAKTKREKIDAITLNAVISSVEKCGLWQIALNLLHQMTELSFADDISFNAAIGACEKGQMLETSGAAKKRSMEDRANLESSVSPSFLIWLETISNSRIHLG
eukprot:Skav209867  [mRNA]  locus=scaffold590:55225:57331:+ [translate_table: standard]